MSEKIVKRIYGVGVWEDEDGAVHFSLREILDACNLPYTPKNEAMVVEEIKDLMRTNFPKAKFVHVTDPPQ